MRSTCVGGAGRGGVGGVGGHAKIPRGHGWGGWRGAECACAEGGGVGVRVGALMPFGFGTAERGAGQGGACWRTAGPAASAPPSARPQGCAGCGQGGAAGTARRRSLLAAANRPAGRAWCGGVRGG